MANIYKNAFLRHMDREGIKYEDRDERTVWVRFSGDNLRTIRITVIFSEDGDPYVVFKNWDIGSFKDDSKYAKGLVACNEMNKKWRWAKFYLDEDRDVTVGCDAIVDEETVGPECEELVRRLVHIIDEVYPEFMRAMYA